MQPPSAGVRPEVGDFAPSKEEEKRDGILRARNEDEAIIGHLPKRCFDRTESTVDS